MKRIYLIAILILLLVVAGAFIMSPFSPLNKVSVNGETVKLSSGYTVQESSNNKLSITNGTNELYIFPTDLTTNLETAISGYKTEYKDNYTITTTEISNSNPKIIKTVAKSNNDTNHKTVTKYWFVHKDTTYNIQTANAVTGTDDVVKSIVGSMK